MTDLQRTDRPGWLYWITVGGLVPAANYGAFLVHLDVLHEGNHVGVPLSVAVLLAEWLGAIAILRFRNLLTTRRAAATIAALTLGTLAIAFVDSMIALIRQHDTS